MNQRLARIVENQSITLSILWLLLVICFLKINISISKNIEQIQDSIPRIRLKDLTITRTSTQFE